MGRITREKRVTAPDSAGPRPDDPADRARHEADRADDAEAARLVARIQAGEAEAFADLYSRYFDRVYSYLRVLLRDPHEAEDATQQVFVKVFEAMPAYEQRRSFWVWLFTVVKHHALNELRRRRRLEVEDPDEIERHREANGETEAAYSLSWVTDQDLLLFIDRLPLPQRQVVAMRYLLDLTNAEIAAALNRTPGDVRILHHRATNFLYDRLISIGRKPSITREEAREAQSSRHNRQAIVLRARRFSLYRH